FSDFDPVGAGRPGAQGVTPDVAEQDCAYLRGRRHADFLDRDQGGQQPSCAAEPELRQVDAALAGHVAQQQRGDEETREHEEDVDAEEPRGQHRGGEVEDQDADDGDGTYAVKTGDVTRTGIDVRWTPPAPTWRPERVGVRALDLRSLQQIGAQGAVVGVRAGAALR